MSDHTSDLPKTSGSRAANSLLLGTMTLPTYGTPSSLRQPLSDEAIDMMLGQTSLGDEFRNLETARRMIETNRAKLGQMTLGRTVSPLEAGREKLGTMKLR